MKNGFENPALGVQVACLTGSHHKEWCYLTHDVDAFLDTFNQCLAGHPVSPIKLNMYKDPGWSILV